MDKKMTEDTNFGEIMSEKPSLDKIVQQLEQVPAEKFNYLYERQQYGKEHDKNTTEKLEFTTTLPNRWYVQVGRAVGFSPISGDIHQQEYAILITVPVNLSEGSSRRYSFDNHHDGDSVKEIYKKVYAKVAFGLTDKCEKTLFATFFNQGTL